MSIIRRFFQSRADQLQLAREEGAREAQHNLVSELGYIIGVRRLLHKAPNKMPQKWVAAYELLFPGTGAKVFSETDVKRGLLILGFPDQVAQSLLTQRAKRPEALVVQLLAVMSGLPEDAVWGMERSD